jgi:magnesium transporter
MLRAYNCGASRMVAVDVKAAPEALPNVHWFDLVQPTAEDYAFVTRETGLALPEQADILEIENSSRLAIEGDVLTVTMPIVTRTGDALEGSSCGFVLSPSRLVTIRFADSLAFDKFTVLPHETGAIEESHAAYIFVGLLEAIVDRQADALERMRTELDQFSHRVFRQQSQLPPEERKPIRNEEKKLRNMLSTLGVSYDNISFLRDSQLGVARIAPFAAASAKWLPAPVDARLKTLQADIDSLNEFSVHLSDKVQFLLDATLGLINVAQSTLMKVFTVVAVIGIPPTLVAGIYGMNFHDMPELSWKYGYAYGWAVIILSAVLPLVWFRIKGWL